MTLGDRGDQYVFHSYSVGYRDTFIFEAACVHVKNIQKAQNI